MIYYSLCFLTYFFLQNISKMYFRGLKSLEIAKSKIVGATVLLFRRQEYWIKFLIPKTFQAGKTENSAEQVVNQSHF